MPNPYGMTEVSVPAMLDAFVSGRKMQWSTEDRRRAQLKDEREITRQRDLENANQRAFSAIAPLLMRQRTPGGVASVYGGSVSRTVPGYGSSSEMRAPGMAHGPWGSPPQSKDPIAGGGIVATREQEADSQRMADMMPSAPQIADDGYDPMKGADEVQLDATVLETPSHPDFDMDAMREYARLAGPKDALALMSIPRENLGKAIEAVDKYNDFVSSVVGAVRRLPEEQRASAYQRLRPQYENMGYDLPDEWDEQLATMYQAQGLTAAQALQAERADRKLEADLSNIEADNERADRSTNNLIDVRSRNAGTNERRAATSDYRAKNPPARGKRAERPRATDKAGNVIEWNGKAWVPVK